MYQSIIEVCSELFFPVYLHRFINRDGIDFSDAQTMQPVQVFFLIFSLSMNLVYQLSYKYVHCLKEWELAENTQGVLEYQTRYTIGPVFCWYTI